MFLTIYLAYITLFNVHITNRPDNFLWAGVPNLAWNQITLHQGRRFSDDQHRQEKLGVTQESFLLKIENPQLNKGTTNKQVVLWVRTSLASAWPKIKKKNKSQTLLGVS